MKKRIAQYRIGVPVGSALLEHTALKRMLIVNVSLSMY
jgi:hypothetical protein